MGNDGKKLQADNNIRAHVLSFGDTAGGKSDSGGDPNNQTLATDTINKVDANRR
jgi:hypothetical protein